MKRFRTIHENTRNSLGIQRHGGFNATERGITDRSKNRGESNRTRARERERETDRETERRQRASEVRRRDRRSIHAEAPAQAELRKRRRQAWLHDRSVCWYGLWFPAGRCFHSVMQQLKHRCARVYSGLYTELSPPPHTLPPSPSFLRVICPHANRG